MAASCAAWDVAIRPTKWLASGRSGASRQKFHETLDVLLKAWTHEESFTHEGEYVKIPTPVTVFQSPCRNRIPLWLAGTSADLCSLPPVWTCSPSLRA
jgi:alkanesulfonate monooxygenase SsuD/methylene tetrahydromethanopterin reductase-like flavin-dependent oxidoreductase (luciferase family)